MIKIEINIKYHTILYPNAQDWLVYSYWLGWIIPECFQFSCPDDGPIFRCFSSGVTANLTSCPPWWLLAYTSSLDLCPVIVAYRLLSNVCCRPFRRKPLGFQIRSVEGIPVWHMQSSWTLDSRPNPITRGQFVLAVKCVKTSGIPLWHAHVKPNVNIINFWIINGLIQDYFESKAKNMDILKHGTRDGTKKLQLQCMQKRVYVYAHTCYMHVYF